MEGITLTLKGREIPLIYTVLEMKRIQEEIAPLGDFIYKVYGRNKDDEEDTSLFGCPEQLDAIAKLVCILGNAGLEEAGENPDLTEKKVLRAIKPNEISATVNACMKAINEGNHSEIPAKKPEGPIDATLEEMDKKKERDG